MTSSAVSARQVVILARAPSAKGKTRLTTHLSPDHARALRERLFVDTLAAACTAGFPVVVSFTPDDAQEEMRRLAGETALMTQRGGDLGARMQNAMLDAFASGADAAVLIGSDLPTLPPRHIRDAFDMLDGVGFLNAEASARAVSPAASRCDVVFGPTEDGGFYLIGARRELPDIFGGVQWSRPDVLARVTGAVHEAGLAVGVVGEWWDVDTPEDLQRWLTGERFTPPDATRQASSE